MNLMIHDTKRFTIQNISSPIHNSKYKLSDSRYDSRFNYHAHRLYDSANKFASRKQTNHNMLSSMSEAKSTIQELNMLLEVESLDENKKRFDKSYMVMILHAMHLNFEHVVRDQLVNRSRSPIHGMLDNTAPMESSVMVSTSGRA